MKTITNNYDFSLSRAPWLQLCRGIRSNQLYTLLKQYTQFFDFMVFLWVLFSFFQTETLLLRAEKRGLCDCFHAIHWNGHWDLANGHLFIFKMLFSKLQEDTECKLCPTIRKSIFIMTGIAQLDYFCFVVVYHYSMWYCIFWNVKRRNSAKVLLMGLCKDRILLFWYFKPKIVPGLSGQPLGLCELPQICESQWSQFLKCIYRRITWKGSYFAKMHR